MNRDPSRHREPSPAARVRRGSSWPGGSCSCAGRTSARSSSRRRATSGRRRSTSTPGSSRRPGTAGSTRWSACSSVLCSGVLLAALATRVPLLGGTITPLVAALAAMPIVALAPLLNNMYSPISTLPRREVVAISAFVPVFINVLRGLSRLDPVHRELMQSYAASGTAVLRTIRIPGAMPYFFTGLRIASSLAVIAAVVSEYFGGLGRTVSGSRITDSVGASDYPAAWASVLGAVALGLIFYISALVLERVVLGRRASFAVLNVSSSSNTQGENDEQAQPQVGGGRCGRRRRRRACRMQQQRQRRGSSTPPTTAPQRRRLGHAWRRRHDAQWPGNQRHAATAVGDPGAVRRLHRGAEEGLLPAAGPEREHRAGRYRHRPAAHRRRRRLGRLRDRLGAEGAAVTRAGREHHRRRPGVPAVRHAADLVQEEQHHLGRRPQGQDRRRLGIRQRVRAVCRHDQGRASTRARTSRSSSSSST